MSVGDRIKAARKEKSLTQTELGKKLNVSQSMIAQYERGDRTPNDDTLQRIAAILDVSYYELSENNSIENLLRTQENLCHSLQNDRDKIIQEIFEFENELYSIERENWNGAMKDELNKKQKELKEKQKELKYVHSKLEHVEEDIKGLRNYLTEIQDLQEEKRTAQRQEEKDELCKRIEELKANAPDIIKNRATNHIQINTSIKAEDVDWKLNDIIQKARRKEELTQEEQQQFNSYLQTFSERWELAKERMNGHLKRLQAVFEQLNESGQEKADEQVDHLIDQLELLTKIPEYQKDPETKTAAPEREPQDGEANTQ